jgi:hypothetical protein
VADKLSRTRLKSVIYSGSIGTCALTFSQLLFGDRQDAHQLIIQIDLQLRLHRQQRRRRRVFEIQQRFRTTSSLRMPNSTDRQG